MWRQIFHHPPREEDVRLMQGLSGAVLIASSSEMSAIMARNINTQVERGFWVVIVALITHGNMYLLLSAGNADTWELT